MSWIRAFLELNKSLFLKGLLLLMAFLLGLQMGQSRLQRRWDAERQAVQIAQAKQEQHATDVAQVQNQISKEISDDYRKKFSMLASRTDVVERVLDKSEGNSSGVPSVSAPAGGVADPLADSVLTPFGNEKEISCKQLIQDAIQTTLMLNAIQIWYERQSINLK
jgi:type II secretory pathway pseudopilin PulG